MSGRSRRGEERGEGREGKGRRGVEGVLMPVGLILLGKGRGRP